MSVWIRYTILMVTHNIAQLQLDIKAKMIGQSLSVTLGVKSKKIEIMTSQYAFYSSSF